MTVACKWWKFIIPPDREERVKAIDTATRSLAQVQEQQEGVDAVAESMRDLLERNHFVERLAAAYGFRRSP